jgi:membrane fusion protein (multidrug efflux system)
VAPSITIFVPFTGCHVARHGYYAKGQTERFGLLLARQAVDDVRHPEPASRLDSIDAPPGRGKTRSFLMLALVLGGLGAGGTYYWLSQRHFESTDDAFVDGHVSQVAPQIAGRVVALLVADNQVVAAGQELVTIDPRDMAVRLDQAVANRAQAAAQLAQARATLGIRRADLGQAQANVTVAQADLYQAQRDLARYQAINPRAITRQLLDNAIAAQRSAAAKLDASRQAAVGMQAQIVAAQAAIDAAVAALRTGDANVADARLQLSYTHIVAPAPGRVTRRTVELGNYVMPGQALLAIVQPGMWVTANFKETQLGDMRPGQPVRIYLDAFPAVKLSGHVDSFQTGTGSMFSALPAENATGNYVKVVQRLPVKILFDGADAARMPLAPGMSVIPTVTVR